MSTNIQFICAGLLLVISGATQAAPYQTSSEQRPYLCKSPEAAQEAWRKKRSSLSGADDMLQSGECREVPPDTKFRVLESSNRRDLTYSRVELFEEKNPQPPAYIGGILNDPVDPEEQSRQRELAKLPIGCTTPAGGEVRQLERGKDGQVFIKRYMVTSKCVNGEMRSFTTPLD